MEEKMINGYSGKYSISNDGQVFEIIDNIILSDNSIVSGKIKVKSYKAKNGYEYVHLRASNSKKKKMHSVHRIVAELFVQGASRWSIVNHIDGVKTNNNATNLEWVNHSKNIQHAYDTGLRSRKMTPDAIRFILDNKDDISIPLLAEKFSVAKKTIYEVLKKHRD